MKLPGRGYTPRASGRPSREVHEVAMPKHLTIELSRRGIEYLPCVGIGQAVAPGDALARVEMHGGVTMLPSPASGRVVEVGEAGSQIKIDTEPTDSDRPSIEPLKPQYATSGLVREAIGRGGLWPVFWSSADARERRLD